VSGAELASSVRFGNLSAHCLSNVLMALVAGVATFETAFARATAFMFERTLQAHPSRMNTALNAPIAI
jgi:hypothetical protein